MSKNSIGHVFSFKNFFFCVLVLWLICPENRVLKVPKWKHFKMKKHDQCYFLTYVWPQKKFGLIFSNFWPIFRHLPPLFVALSQKVSCVTFQNYQISMYNSNTDSLGLILGVEVFFSIGHCSGALCIRAGQIAILRPFAVGNKYESLTTSRRISTSSPASQPRPYQRDGVRKIR